TIVEQVKLFTESEVPDFGEVGAVTRDDPRRSIEYKVHGDRITDQRVARWRREEDPALRRQAEECHARMPEYGEYWGYRE
ncbi:MAG: sulfotransferase, partial [Nitrospirae bacterium CG_4_10_14_3_um_filter_70_108]